MDILISFFFILLGASLCLLGYTRWKGKIHWSYFSYGFLSEINYQAIPLGISAMVIGIATISLWPRPIPLVLTYVAIFVMMLGLLVAWRLFKPGWVKWIEDNHKEIIPYLMVEIRDYGWHVETQEELENWVIGLYQKYRHNLER